MSICQNMSYTKTGFLHGFVSIEQGVVKRPGSWSRIIAMFRGEMA